MNPIIKVNGISKRYKIGQIQGYKTLRDSLSNFFHPRRSLPPEGGGNVGVNDYIWALKDVSFEVQPGEVIGIIGRNGAGKSTLLKILTRITEPTEGTAELEGRVSSLLEVGTGFHPELTGRENIYLNGAILGMRKAEIARKFDEIVAFSEVEKFIDTPVKRYSSGMYVRLAFAVAAHLEPEILLVDEVLAVGDAAFQKKCLGKMGEVAREGRTVLFVSHNMQAIRKICQRVILLESGAISADGLSDKVIGKYLGEIPNDIKSSVSLDNLIRRLPPDPVFRLESIVLTQDKHLVRERVMNGQPLEIEIKYEDLKQESYLRIFFDLYDSEETLVFRSSYDDQEEDVQEKMVPGHYVSRVKIPADFLSPLNYELRVSATIFNTRYLLPESGVRIPLHVERTGKVNRAYFLEPSRGKISPLLPWETVRV